MLQIGETLDSWQKFMTLYKAVMSWVEEKQTFLTEPLQLSNLTQARQKLHDYSVSLYLINTNYFEETQYCISIFTYVHDPLKWQSPMRLKHHVYYMSFFLSLFKFGNSFTVNFHFYVYYIHNYHVWNLLFLHNYQFVIKTYFLYRSVTSNLGNLLFR